MKRIDLSGQTFCRLLVLQIARRGSNGVAYWLCRCECGADKEVRGDHLRRGLIQSCGCLNRELARERTYVGDAAQYGTAHSRIKKQRGRAAEYPCVDCGGRADEWSLRSEATQTRTQIGGRFDGRRYSTDVSDYDPRCKECHRIYDNHPFCALKGEDR